jgi:hypothetical protein
MTNKTNDSDTLFRNLVMQFHQSALIFLGEIANPQTGKIDKNPANALYFIDMLRMLEEKTSGNLAKEEAKNLHDILRSLESLLARGIGGKR